MALVPAVLRQVAVLRQAVVLGWAGAGRVQGGSGAMGAHPCVQAAGRWTHPLVKPHWNQGGNHLPAHGNAHARVCARSRRRPRDRI